MNNAIRRITVGRELADPSETDEDTAEALTRKFQRELAAGLTALVLLSVLGDSSEDLYGYEIARRLSAATGEASPFKPGALYPVLRNMSASGLLTSRVVPSYSGPPRRYYRITRLGREVLASWCETWSTTRSFVDAIVARPEPQEIPT